MAWTSGKLGEQHTRQIGERRLPGFRKGVFTIFAFGFRQRDQFLRGLHRHARITREYEARAKRRASRSAPKSLMTSKLCAGLRLCVIVEPACRRDRACNRPARNERSHIRRRARCSRRDDFRPRPAGRAYRSAPAQQSGQRCQSCCRAETARRAGSDDPASCPIARQPDKPRTKTAIVQVRRPSSQTSNQPRNGLGFLQAFK